MSSKETTENFWQVWNNFVWPDPVPIMYRLYYNDDGTPRIYTMEDLPGAYIEVSREIYLLAPGNARVENGVLRIISPARMTRKLKPTSTKSVGTPCHPNDVCIVSDGQDSTNWSLQDD